MSNKRIVYLFLIINVCKMQIFKKCIKYFYDTDISKKMHIEIFPTCRSKESSQQSFRWPDFGKLWLTYYVSNMRTFAKDVNWNFTHNLKKTQCIQYTFSTVAHTPKYCIFACLVYRLIIIVDFWLSLAWCKGSTCLFFIHRPQQF